MDPVTLGMSKAYTDKTVEGLSNEYAPVIGTTQLLADGGEAIVTGVTQ